MAKVASNPNTRVWLDQYDITGFANASSMDITQELMVATALSDAGPRRIVGNYDHKHSVTALFDGVAAQSDAIIESLLGDDDDHYLCAAFGANAENSVAHSAIVKLVQRPHRTASGQLIILETQLEGANGIARGLVLANFTASGTGARTGRNQGTTTSGQTYQAVVRVLSGTFTSITVRIQESSDDGGVDLYADIAGMTTTLTAAGVARLTTTAATEAWKRVNIQAFTGTSAVIVVTGGVVQGT